MFTIVKVRKDIADYSDPGWYKHPPGEVADVADPARLKADGIDPGPPPPRGSGLHGGRHGG
jgi:hypothetical protein